jgi:uncharacterized protein YqeY
MTLKQKIISDLKAALKNQERGRLSVLRMLSAAIHNREIEKRTKSGVDELTDEEVVAAVRSEVKKRRDAIVEFEKGGRQDLAAKETYERGVLEGYLAQELSDTEIEQVVKGVIGTSGEFTPRDFGKIMGQVMVRLKGQASGERVSRMVKKFLQ